MKKGMSKLLSALLIAMLVFTSAGVAFADTAEKDAINAVGQEAQKKAVDMLSATDLGQKAVKQAVQNQAQTKAAVGTVPVTTMKTGYEKPIARAITYNATDTVRDGTVGLSQRTYLPAKGSLIMTVHNAKESNQRVNYGIYSDSALRNQVHSKNYSGYAQIGATTTYVFTVPAAGYYYIGVYSPSYDTPVTSVGIVASAVFVSGADRTVSNGASIAVGQQRDQTNYFRFKAANTGYLKIQSTDYGTVSLCNSSKKALSKGTSTSYAPTYGVKKGSTYYIKVAASYNRDGYYRLKVTNGKITEKSGSKKSKARTIKKKKTYKGTITAGSSQADWYKFKLTSKKKITMTIKGATNGKMKVIVYNKKGKKVSSANTFGYYNSKLTLKSYGKLSKGTYYVKIYRGDKYSSGWYSVYWK